MDAGDTEFIRFGYSDVSSVTAMVGRIMSKRRDKAEPPSEARMKLAETGLARPISEKKNGRTSQAYPEIGSDIDEQERRPIFSLLQGQSEILDLISGQAPLQETLDRVAVLAEQAVGAALCSVQVLDTDGKRFYQVAAPNLPPEFLHDIKLGRVSDEASAGAICAGSRLPLYISDISADTRQVPAVIGDLMHACGFRSVWAHPVLDRSGEPIGALTLYFQVPRRPDPGDKQIVDALSGLARSAIEHDRWDVALRSAHQRFGALAANIPGVVYQRMVTPDGQIRYTYISDGAKELFGVSPEEILSDPNALFDCHGAQYRETFRENLLEASRNLTMWDVEASIVTKDGERKFTHAIARPHRTPDGTVLWDGVILDATRIKEAELEAASIETRTREAILESISQGLVLFDEDDSLVVCNSHFLDLFPGLGKVIRPGMSYESVATLLIDRSLNAEATAAVRDELLQQQIQSHRSGDNTAELCLPSGRWVLITEHRTSYGSTAIVYTDVTELKKREAELENSNDELQQFASVASHDLQEPLRKIEAFGNRLKSLCGGQFGEEATLYLDRMQSSTRRMRNLINDLLSYSRVTTKSRPMEPCDLEAIAAEVVSDLQIQVEESGGSVEIGKLAVVEADAMQIRQLLQNLISNAIKFRRTDIAPVVKVSGQIKSGSTRPAGPASHSGKMYELIVSDNGIGFEMEYSERIFVIFQRLHNHSEYEGTGIGLATCRKIVEKHGGALYATSTPGEGSAFTAVLPMKQALTETTK